jgi:hypothetical protein
VSHDTKVQQESVLIAARWKKAGGALDYVMMDSPLYFGHYAMPACDMPIDAIAVQAAATVAGIRQSFPNVEFVDADGPGPVIPQSIWIPDMVTWIKAFKAATGGVPISSVALDQKWLDPRPGASWQQTVRDSVSNFAPLGVQTSIVLDANQPAVFKGSDAVWRRAVSLNAAALAQSNLGLSYVVVAEWQGKITNNLPESDPSSWTSVISEWVREEARAKGR